MLHNAVYNMRSRNRVIECYRGVFSKSILIYNERAYLLISHTRALTNAFTCTVLLVMYTLPILPFEYLPYILNQ